MARYDDIYEYEPNLDGRGVRVGIALARFNQEVGDGLLSACVAELHRLGVSPDAVAIASEKTHRVSRMRSITRRSSDAWASVEREVSAKSSVEQLRGIEGARYAPRSHPSEGWSFATSLPRCKVNTR